MHLQIKPYSTNAFPLGGILIKSNSLEYWLLQLQSFDVDIKQVPVYAIPGNMANSLWGCFVPLPENKWKQKLLNANEPCQLVYNNLYIPQYATIYPMISAAEAAKIFPSTPHILHPEFGLVLLDTPIQWSDLLLLPDKKAATFIKPQPAAFTPENIRRLEIKPLPPEELLKVMEETVFPKKQTFNDKPLNWAEKIKLGLLRTLFTTAKKGTRTGKKEKTGIMNMLEKIANKILPGNSQWINNLEQDLEQLEKRNESEMEKLMELFKNNPEEALKYAIPLDNDGTNRGGNAANFELNKRWSNFNLFGNDTFRGSGNTIFGMDSYQRLQQQYNQTAQQLIEQKNYEKAAFVYMKLLKNNHMAAKTLEDGKLYPEAASVYLKYLESKSKAAECYEKGQMLTDAIVLYKELKQNEKAGDLYMLQQKQKEAFEQYSFVADEHINAGKYVKAALLYRNKMNKAAPAQNLLLKGWRTDKDAFNCLNNYFENIEDPKLLLQAIENVYAKDTSDFNKPVFLKALKYEQKKGELVASRIKEIAYEVIADLAINNPDIVTELKNFNDDKSLIKDVLRYKAQRRQE
jgi:MoxR-vWA-beta-propeller ternary system domain bpX3